MVSSISSNYSAPYTTGYSLAASASKTSFNNMSNSIAAEKHKTVTIDGQTYDVVKVLDEKSGLSTIQPSYKEVVIIDGQQYDLETVSDPIACDKTKEVVTIEGKQYDVDDNSSGQKFDIFA